MYPITNISTYVPLEGVMALHVNLLKMLHLGLDWGGVEDWVGIIIIGEEALHRYKIVPFRCIPV